MRLILASASPRRADLLRAAGFEFETIAVDVDESVRPGEQPAAYVRRLAAEKSAAALAALKPAPSSPFDKLRTSVEAGCAISGVAQDFPGPPKRGTCERGSPAELVVLAADTAVVVDGQTLGKPCDDHEAADMLRRLSGRRHDVLTGVSLRRNAYDVGRVETTAVYFAALTSDDVAWYVGSGEGRDKAGAYAIQGLASRFVVRIEGSYANVVGLPVAAVVDLMREIGVFGR